MSKTLKLKRGTTVENNTYVGSVSELTFDTDTKGLRIHDGSKVGGYMVDSVIAFQRPTEANNYTWYRLYASGWVEQGGWLGRGTAGDVSITFPIEMEEAPKSCNQMMYNITNSNGVAWTADSFRNITATGLQALRHTDIDKSWDVKGMASATAIADILGE